MAESFDTIEELEGKVTDPTATMTRCGQPVSGQLACIKTRLSVCRRMKRKDKGLVQTQ